MKCYFEGCNNPPTLTCPMCGNYACNQHKGRHQSYLPNKYICKECVDRLEQELQTNLERARLAKEASRRDAEEFARKQRAYENELVECPRCNSSRGRRFFAVIAGCSLCGGSGQTPRRKADEYIRTHPEPEPEPESPPDDPDPWSHGSSWKSNNPGIDW